MQSVPSAVPLTSTATWALTSTTSSVFSVTGAAATAPPDLAERHTRSIAHNMEAQSIANNLSVGQVSIVGMALADDGSEHDRRAGIC